jgi:hypothetical protein
MPQQTILVAPAIPIQLRFQAFRPLQVATLSGFWGKSAAIQTLTPNAFFPYLCQP